MAGLPVAAGRPRFDAEVKSMIGVSSAHCGFFQSLFRFVCGWHDGARPVLRPREVAYHQSTSVLYDSSILSVSPG
jgi:hypothetical protein